MNRAVIALALAACAQAEPVPLDDGSMVMSAGERAIIVRVMSEQAETIKALRKDVERLNVATGCT